MKTYMRLDLSSYRDVFKILPVRCTNRHQTLVKNMQDFETFRRHANIVFVLTRASVAPVTPCISETCLIAFPEKIVLFKSKAVPVKIK